MINFSIDFSDFLPNLFIRLYLGFILFTPIGTLLHEGGHFLAAKSFGYKATMNYKSTYWKDSLNETFLNEIKIKKNLDFTEKTKYKNLLKRADENDTWITLAGPVQTLLFGSIGLFLLHYRRLKIRMSQKLSSGDWLLVFLSLFWLRQLANFIVWLGKFLVTGVLSEGSDEVILAMGWELPLYTFTASSAIIAIAVLAYIVFKILPIHLRFTFILSGIFGGITGYILWLEIFGKLILP